MLERVKSKFQSISDTYDANATKINVILPLINNHSPYYLILVFFAKILVIRISQL